MDFSNFTVGNEKVFCPENYICIIKDQLLPTLKTMCSQVILWRPINLLLVVFMMDMVEILIRNKIKNIDPEKILFLDYTPKRLFFIYKTIKAGLLITSIVWMIWGFSIIQLK